MNKEEISQLKSEGFIPIKNGLFSVRIISDAGVFSAKKMNFVNEIAQKFGNGTISFTTRLCIEIPMIKPEDIDSVKKAINEAGLTNGGTGKKVRPVVACKGTVCSHGLFDTQGIANKIKDEFFMKQTLPSKFKIGLVGCPNNCAKASLNDLGFVGQAYVSFDEEKCISCGKCISVCKAKALSMENKKLNFDKDQCVNCGECSIVCPFDAMTVIKKGMSIYIGGRFGRNYRIGDKLDDLYSPEDALKITEKVIDYYKTNAEQGERFASMIERIGIKKVKNEIL